MRIAEKEVFPYTDSTICFIYITSNGEPKQVGFDINRDEAYKAVKSGEGRLIAVWPGRYRSDAFDIDISEFGRVFGYEDEEFPGKIISCKRGDTSFDTRGSQLWELEIEFNSESDAYMPNFLERLEKELNKTYICTLAISKGHSSRGIGKRQTVSVFAKTMIPL